MILSNMNKKITQYAVLHAIGTAVYISLVASVMSNAEAMFGKVDNTTLAPIGFLMLFVVSAAITGLLVFARPLAWYLDGKKKEGIKLAITTVAFLVLITLVVLIALMAG